MQRQFGVIGIAQVDGHGWMAWGGAVLRARGSVLRWVNDRNGEYPLFPASVSSKLSDEDGKLTTQHL